MGKPCGTVPTILTPCSVSPKPQTAVVVATMATIGPTFARMSAGRSPQPKTAQEGLEAAAHPEEKGQRSEADHRGIGIDVAEVVPHRYQNIQQVLAFRVDAEHRRKLTGRDLDARGGDEARDDRVAEKVREKSQPQQPHGEQQQAGDQWRARWLPPDTPGFPGHAICPAAAAVIRLATATGPTASVREVPKIA